MSWQPIETVPEDKEVLLGWRYRHNGEWKTETGWGKSSNNCAAPYSNAWQHGSATHWMPLPEPPPPQDEPETEDSNARPTRNAEEAITC